MTKNLSIRKPQTKQVVPVLDPVSRAIANAPVDDEPETEEEHKAVAESKAWFDQCRGQEIAHEAILADFGITLADLT